MHVVANLSIKADSIDICEHFEYNHAQSNFKQMYTNRNKYSNEIRNLFIILNDKEKFSTISDIFSISPQNRRLYFKPKGYACINGKINITYPFNGLCIQENLAQYTNNNGGKLFKNNEVTTEVKIFNSKDIAENVVVRNILINEFIKNQDSS
jgi:hypothetical protein